MQLIKFDQFGLFWIWNHFSLMLLINSYFLVILCIWSVFLDHCFDRRRHLQTSISVNMSKCPWPRHRSQNCHRCCTIIAWMSVNGYQTKRLTASECDKRETLWETDRLERCYVNTTSLSTYYNLFSLFFFLIDQLFGKTWMEIVAQHLSTVE